MLIGAVIAGVTAGFKPFKAELKPAPTPPKMLEIERPGRIGVGDSVGNETPFKILLRGRFGTDINGRTVGSDNFGTDTVGSTAGSDSPGTYAVGNTVGSDSPGRDKPVSNEGNAAFVGTTPFRIDETPGAKFVNGLPTDTDGIGGVGRLLRTLERPGRTFVRGFPIAGVDILVRVGKLMLSPGMVGTDTLREGRFVRGLPRDNEGSGEGVGKFPRMLERPGTRFVTGFPREIDGSGESVGKLPRALESAEPRLTEGSGLTVGKLPSTLLRAGTRLVKGFAMPDAVW